MNIFTKLKNMGKSGNDMLTYLLFFVITLIKSGYYFFSYSPILDDFIQYGVYQLYQDPLNDILIQSGFISARPLAGIFDVFVWGRFHDNLSIAYIIIIVLHSLSGIFLFKLFKRHFNVSFVFLLCYGLFPLNSEALNWLSASSRLIVPVFFMSVGLFLMQKFFDGKKIYFGILSSFFILLSFSFYEQVIILSFILTLGLIVINKKSFLNYLLLIVPSILIILPYVLIPSNSLYGQRIALISLNGDLVQHMLGVLKAALYSITSLSENLINNGLRNGLSVIKNDQNYMFLILTIAAVACVFLLSYKRNQKEDREIKNTPDLVLLIVSLILIIAPMLLFFIIKNPWISLRNTFPSVLGISLFIDLIFRYVAKLNIVKSVLISLMCLVFIIASASDLSDYKRAGLIDKQIAENTVKYINENNINHVMTIIGTKDSYVDASTQYHEHINNITSSDWAYLGAIISTSKNLSMPPVFPLAPGKINELYPNINEITNFYTLDKNYNIIALTHSMYKENYNIYKNGELFAEIFTDDKDGAVLVLINDKKEAD